MQSPVRSPSTPRAAASPTHARQRSGSTFLSPRAHALSPGGTTRTPFTTPRAPLTPPDSSAKARALALSGSLVAAGADLAALAGSPGGAPSLQSLVADLQDSPLAQRGARAPSGPAAQAGAAAPELTPSSTLSSVPSAPSMTFSDASALSASSSAATDVSAGATPAPHAAADAKTPNVYINGLPPNFPEEALFQMTRDFGPVCSVRTFTRHVADRPSGYGFVLYENVESAERCIESLRKYRNLHPSFSKQVHKIPGTAYANVPASANRVTNQDPKSFKARMEHLKDEASTNLYMEGLPLSIDEPQLATLVSPYQIKSSRFFQTKLSHPPRIIAFVRLESRVACEDVIERLHGRMVRGWNDTGSRISVRFADSNGQRELRKSERSHKDVAPDVEQNPPAKLTIAQASLLNLRGGSSPMLSPSVSLPSVSPTQDYAFSPFINNSPNLTASASLPSMPSSGSHSRLPMHPLVAPYQQPVAAVHGAAGAPAHLDPHMAALLQTLQATTLADSGSRAQGPKFTGFTPVEQQLLLQAQAFEAQRKALEVQQQVLALEAQREALRAQEQARLAMQQQQQQQQQQARAAAPPANQAFAPIELVPPMVRTQPAPPPAQQQLHARNRTTTGAARHFSAGHPAAPAQALPHSRSTTLPGAQRPLAPPAAPSPTCSVSSAASTVRSDSVGGPAVKISLPSARPAGGEDGDSPLVSPALSYSSRGSPAPSSAATLSPMTPAFVPGQLAGFLGGAGGNGAAAAAPAASGGAQTNAKAPQQDSAVVVGLGVDIDGEKVEGAQ